MVAPRISWKKTLHLPKSSFPARPNIKDRPKYLRRSTDDIYAWQSKRKLQTTFTLHDGPPYANGQLHIGHALNKILKDIICRSKLPDHRVDWRPGWDCHGLPIELKALQQQGHRASSDAVSVRAAARKLATATVEVQKQSFRKWGIMADWDHAWTTMDRNFEIEQLDVFKQLVKRGLIYRRFKPVYWSPSSHTALAEAELEYRDDHISTAAFIKYRLDYTSGSLMKKLGIDSEDVSAVIWTTQPWTLPANKAIGVHEDIEYVIVKSALHGLLLLAASRLSEVEHHLNESMPIIHSIEGRDLLDTTYVDSVFDSVSPSRPLLHADFVSETSGSGLVHFAPGHGIDEYELCSKNHIMAFAPLDDKGCFTCAAYPEEPGYLAGKDVLGAGNQAVLSRMGERGQLLAQQQYSHSYPYDWRSKQPVIQRATEQWFASVGDIQQSALHALDNVKFVPSSSKTRLQNFVKNRNEWCISRQRAWGVPIPALYHIESKEPLLTEHSIAHIIAIIRDRGIDAWWTDDEFEPAWIPDELKDGDRPSSYRRGKDTMDVWFDSGSSWTQTHRNGEPDSHVADCYIEGTDQHRGWFQSSLLTHVAAQSRPDGNGNPATAPYRTLITHGFTLDQDGRKMSKSVGNVISPDEIMNATLLPPAKRKINDQVVDFRDALGPDALRLWAASCDYFADVRVSQAVLQAINSTLSKYRITFKLMLGLLNDFDPNHSSYSENQKLMHRIIQWRLQIVNSNIRDLYNTFEFSRVVGEINRFIISDLSSSYFEWIKDAAYCGNVRERTQVQQTIYQAFCHLQQMLAPITPLLIEEVWDYTPKQIKDYERTPPAFHSWKEPHWQPTIYSQLEVDVPQLKEALAVVKGIQETARSQKKMGDSLQSFVCFESDSTKVRELFGRYDSEQLQNLFGVSSFKYTDSRDLLPEILKAGWAYTECVKIVGDEVRVHVYEPQAAKCVRCWRYMAPLVAHEAESLCSRCEIIIVDLRKSTPELFE